MGSIEEGESGKGIKKENKSNNYIFSYFCSNSVWSLYNEFYEI